MKVPWINSHAGWSAEPTQRKTAKRITHIEIMKLGTGEVDMPLNSKAVFIVISMVMVALYWQAAAELDKMMSDRGAWILYL